VKRLANFFLGEEVEVCGHRVTFCGIGGATVATLRAKLSGMDVGNFCIVYVEIGTNDLCRESAAVVASNIWALAAYLRTHGAALVILGEVYFGPRDVWEGHRLGSFRGALHITG